MARKHTFSPKRVYDKPSKSDGLRVLVDRLWPRGLSKAEARVDLWLKDLAPSDALRRAVHGEEISWTAFVAAYQRELSIEPAKSAVVELLQRPAGTVTLLYASKDTKHNNAVVLAARLRGVAK